MADPPAKGSTAPQMGGMNSGQSWRKSGDPISNGPLPWPACQRHVSGRLASYEESLRSLSIIFQRQRLDRPPSVLAKVAMALGKRLGVNASLERKGFPAPIAACVRATSIARYREQTLNRYDQDRAPQEEHEIRDDPGHHLSDEGDRSDGVCSYDQRYRR